MTLDECIVDCEQVMFGAQTMKQTEAYNYNRQLAKWLKELKAWRDFGNSIGRVLGKHFTKEELFKMMEVTADGLEENS